MTEQERKELKIGSGYCACKNDSIGACDYHMATDVTGNILIIVSQLDGNGNAKS